MRQKQIILYLHWNKKESAVRKELWWTKLFVKHPHLEEFYDFINPHIEEESSRITIHHDTEAEVKDIFKVLLVALSKKGEDISYIEIATDICLDDIEDGLWLTSLMPDANIVTDYFYSANLSHITNSNNLTNENN